MTLTSALSVARVVALLSPAFPALPASANIARHLAAHASAHPEQPALKIPRGRSAGRIDYLALSYAELSAEVAAHRTRLSAAGLRPGDRVLVMVPQGLPLLAVVFALFELGALPIVIDPGMGRKNFLRCVAHSHPRVLVGIPVARLASLFFRQAFRSVKVRVGVSGSATARLTPPGARRAAADAGALVRAATDPAAILFTSGSTGAPKGVCYTHGQFDAQVRLIREAYHIQPGEIDLPLLPLFALFAPALGLTTIVPELDPSRPARADPARLVEAILQEGVTTSFGSPTLWGNIAAYCHRRGQKLPALRRVLCAGAPVPPWLWESLAALMPGGTPHSPYGATEALPVSTIAAPDVVQGTALATLEGAGVCVGRVLAPNVVKIIAPQDGAIPDISLVRELPPGEIGEIVVAGPTVTTAYDGLPEATAVSKIRLGRRRRPAAGPQDGEDLTLASPSIPAPAEQPSLEVWDLAAGVAAPEGAVFHRMGDLGYLDSAGRLWFVGRKAETVRTERGPFYPAQVEPLFDAHAEVRRTALVGSGPAGRQRPCMVVEPVDPKLVGDSCECRRLARELRVLALRHVHTAQIKVFYFRESLPVDVRHNAKIHRLTLAAWVAGGAVGYESDPKR